MSQSDCDLIKFSIAQRRIGVPRFRTPGCGLRASSSTTMSIITLPWLAAPPRSLDRFVRVSNVSFCSAVLSCEFFIAAILATGDRHGLSGRLPFAQPELELPPSGPFQYVCIFFFFDVISSETCVIDFVKSSSFSFVADCWWLQGLLQRSGPECHSHSQCDNFCSAGMVIRHFFQKFWSPLTNHSCWTFLFRAPSPKLAARPWLASANSLLNRSLPKFPFRLTHEVRAKFNFSQILFPNICLIFCYPLICFCFEKCSSDWYESVGERPVHSSCAGVRWRLPMHSVKFNTQSVFLFSLKHFLLHSRCCLISMLPNWMWSIVSLSRSNWFTFRNSDDFVDFDSQTFQLFGSYTLAHSNIQ